MRRSKNKKCSFESCDRDHKCKGLCDTHYSQMRKGKPLTPIRIWPSPEERLWSRVNKTPSCWIFTGHQNTTGYGLIKIAGKPAVAHRFAYELLVGPIPAGKVLDHTCYEKTCVNPDHLRVVTQEQNSENRRGANKNSKSGIRGVHWEKRSRKWVAQVGETVAGQRKVHMVGRYDSIEEAEAAVIAARNAIFTNNLMDRKKAA